MFDCSICIAEKEIRLCKNIAKFLQNLPFQLAKFCILDAQFEIFFFAKNRGDRLNRVPTLSCEGSVPMKESFAS